MELLKAENNKPLFDTFNRIFVQCEKEKSSWGDYMDFCDYSDLFKDRTNCMYHYN